VIGYVGAGGRTRTDTSVRKPDFASHYGFRHARLGRLLRLSGLVGWTLSSPWAFAFRWLPLSLYTFLIAQAWLGVGIVDRRKRSPNLTADYRPVSRPATLLKSGASTSSATPAHRLIYSQRQRQRQVPIGLRRQIFPALLRHDRQIPAGRPHGDVIDLPLASAKMGLPGCGYPRLRRSLGRFAFAAPVGRGRLAALLGGYGRAWYVYRCRVDRVLDVNRIEFTDHLHAGAAVLGNLIDVRPFHRAEADVGMAKARLSRMPFRHTRWGAAR
jgi:hypothetical protein